MGWLSDEYVYELQLFWGVLNVIFGLLGLYFVYRWGVTLLATDDSVRRVLMGEPFFTWFASSDSFILIFAAAYLGFKLMYILITTARWEINMEHTRRRLMGARRSRHERERQVERDSAPDGSVSAPRGVYVS